MNCPYCGTHNERHSEACGGCRNSLVPTITDRSSFVHGALPDCPAAGAPVGIDAGVNDMTVFAHVGPRRFAGFWIRLAAYAVDMAIISCISVVLALLAAASVKSANQYLGAGECFSAALPYVMIGTAIVELFYFVYFHAVTGQTIGKRLFRIRVIGTHRYVPGYVTALVRYFGYVFSRLPLYAGFLWIAVDKQKQGWHDKLAKTLVVHH